ncbi:MAG: DUF5685 family protein [Bacillota bacterium]|jgi:hypothetical protein
MFGYVMANQNGLSAESKERYQSAYCGLCHALGRLHGSFSRLTLNYDLTFLAIFLAALYEENVMAAEFRCGLHPFKKRRYLHSPAVDYAADMNIALSYYNLLDNWQDDKSYVSRAEAALLQKQCLRVEEKYPRQCGAIKESLRALAAMERDNILNPDLPASCFGNLMAEIFVREEDAFSLNLRRFGFALGKYIYLLDAMLDLKKDIKQEKYNPLIAYPTDTFRESLCILMYDCTEAFNKFEKLRQDELLLNILYSGVWLKFEMQQARANKKQEKTAEKQAKK